MQHVNVHCTCVVVIMYVQHVHYVEHVLRTSCTTYCTGVRTLIQHQVQNVHVVHFVQLHVQNVHIVVYLALSLRMSLHVCSNYVHVHVHTCMPAHPVRHVLVYMRTYS